MGTRERVRLHEPDRPPPTKLVVGPAEAVGYRGYRLPCWVVEWQGPGYVDHDCCHSKHSVDFVVRHFKCRYPGIKVEWRNAQARTRSDP